MHTSYVLSYVFVGLSITCMTYASASKEDGIIYEIKDFHETPEVWQKVKRAPQDHLLELNIALTQANFGLLEEELYEVSDPFNARYGQHLTREQVNDLVRPTHLTETLVVDWLLESGITADQLSYSDSHDWIYTSLNVGVVEKLLNTTYFVFKHKNTGEFVVRAPAWSLPKHLHPHITTVQPTNSFFLPRLKERPIQTSALSRRALWIKGTGLSLDKRDIGDVCDHFNVTPTCLRTLYNTINYKPKVTGKNVIGLANFLGEFNNKSDIRQFLSMYRPEAVGAENQIKTVIINNGSNQQTPITPEQEAEGLGIEGDLDAETILGIAYPTPLLTYNTGGSPPFNPDDATPQNTNEPYLVWLKYLFHHPHLPPVISASYADNEQTVPRLYAEAACREFAKLTARGVSLIFASGDNGVGQNGDCFTNDGNHTRTFLPEFPPSCPYITAVGATMGFDPEVAANDPTAGFTSGGGFSNYFQRPRYQDTAVATYAKRAPNAEARYKGLFNANGRAYPDVAAYGVRLATVWFSFTNVADGTSASTPVFAAIIALVNDALIAKGHSPLGFLNPFIYSVGNKGFTDIVSGLGKGCKTDGFPTKHGWDPVTGYGTPRFRQLIDLAIDARRAALEKRQSASELDDVGIKP